MDNEHYEDEVIMEEISDEGSGEDSLDEESGVEDLLEGSDGESSDEGIDQEFDVEESIAEVEAFFETRAVLEAELEEKEQIIKEKRKSLEDLERALMNLQQNGAKLNAFLNAQNMDQGS